MPRLGIPPLAVLGVLGPPEEVGVRDADFGHDLLGNERNPHHEPPLGEGAVPLLGQREDERGLVVLRRLVVHRFVRQSGSGTMSSSITQAWSRPSDRNSVKAMAQPPAGPRLMSDLSTRTGRPSEMASASTGGSLALSTISTVAGGSLWATMACRHRSKDAGALCVRTSAAVPEPRAPPGPFDTAGVSHPRTGEAKDHAEAANAVGILTPCASRSSCRVAGRS